MKSIVLLSCFFVILAVVHQTEAECDYACPLNLDTICAKSKDGKETKLFDNDCDLRLGQCQEPDKGWTMLKKGNC